MSAAGQGRRRDEQSELVLAALGGLGEIGMNAYLYGIGPARSREWLMVDLGITFPQPDQDPGVDVILPDVRFLEGRRERLAGILLTHAHEDHFGAVIDLWPRLKAPLYATPFTAALLKAKLGESGRRPELPVTVVETASRFRIGSFDIELVNVSHSIPEPNAVAIRTPHGVVVHTGDWKLDASPVVGAPADEARLAAIGEEGVLALVCDSTNAFRDGRSPSELDVTRSLTAIVKGAKRRVAVTTFASNVARIRAVADAARASGRQLVVAGRALHRIIDVAIETGYLPKGFAYYDQTHFKHLDANEVVALCTGSQGESRAALARIGEGEHPEVKLGAGDLVIFSSRTIPGNEKSVGRVQNNLARLGCEIVTDADKLVHVTGHPRRDELRQMYGWMRPRVAVPMHGEMRHLREHAAIAMAAGVAEVFPVVNGEVVRLDPSPRVIDEIPVGRLYRDGRLIVPAGEGPVKERRTLAFVGVVAIAMLMSRKGELIGEAEVTLDGVPRETADGEAMTDVVLDAIDETIESIPRDRRRDVAVVREAVRRAVRSAIDQEWGKKPVVKVLIVGGTDRG